MQVDIVASHWSSGNFHHFVIGWVEEVDRATMPNVTPGMRGTASGNPWKDK